MDSAQQLRIASADQVVTDMLRLLKGMAPDSTYRQHLDMTRRAILASVANDAEHGGGLSLRHYVEQLEDVDRRITGWEAAGDAAELCQRSDHFDAFPDAPGTADLQATIDAHVRAHLED